MNYIANNLWVETFMHGMRAGWSVQEAVDAANIAANSYTKKFISLAQGK